MDIRCRKTNCKFNKKYTCQAKEIDISKEILCHSYASSEKHCPDTTRSMFEVAPEYAPQRESKPESIMCKAPCFFNDKCRCVANGITINALDEKPYCITFLKK